MLGKLAEEMMKCRLAWGSSHSRDGSLFRSSRLAREIEVKKEKGM